jgi:hypothetical protein
MLPKTSKMPIALCLLFCITNLGRSTWLAVLHRAGYVPHRKLLLKVTQLKQLDADLDRNRAFCQVNCSIHLKNVAGGRNVLAGYNRRARQPPMNSTELVCGRDVAG